MNSANLPKGMSAATGQLILRLLEPSAEAVGAELAATIGSWAKVLRLANLDSIAGYVVRLRKQRDARESSRHGLVRLPPRVVIETIDAASLEDDPELQRYWAALIANAQDGLEKPDDLRVFVDTLRSLRAFDARVMTFLHQYWQHRTPSSVFIRGEPLNAKLLCAELGAPVDSLLVSLTSLWRLGLIEMKNSGPDFEHGVFSMGPPAANEAVNFFNSSLGERLLLACKADRPQE